MSVINNKGFVNQGVTQLQIVEKFPCEVARDGFSSSVNITLSSIQRQGTSNVFLLNYTLEHTITYRFVNECNLKTTVKNYTIVIPLELTSPPAVGTLPTIDNTITLGDMIFVDTCGRSPEGRFNKFIRNVSLEFAVSTAPAA